MGKGAWTGPYKMGLVTENKRHVNEAWEQSLSHNINAMKKWPAIQVQMKRGRPNPRWKGPPASWRWEAERKLQNANSRFSLNAKGRMIGPSSSLNQSNPWQYPLTQKQGMCSPSCTNAIGLRSNRNGRWSPDMHNSDAPGGGFKNPGEKFGCYKACLIQGGGFSARINGGPYWAALKREIKSKGAMSPELKKKWPTGWGFLHFEAKLLAVKEMRCLNSNWREPSQFAMYGMWYWYAKGKWSKESPQKIYAEAIRYYLKKDPKARVSYGDINACKRTTGNGEWKLRAAWNFKRCWGRYQKTYKELQHCQSRSAVKPASLIRADCQKGGPPAIRNHPNKAAAGMALLRLCSPCATKCEVRKTCNVRAIKITHIVDEDVTRVDLSKVAAGLKSVGGAPLCTNF